MESAQLENIENTGAGASNPTGTDGPSPPLELSEIERQILNLYDRLEELELEISLLQAQETIPSDLPEIVTEKDLQDAQEALLEAKARYTLRNNIVESILIANPTLKAIHSGLSASPIERDLLPLIQERDALSVSLTETSAELLSTTEKLTMAEAEHVIAARKNIELAATMIDLADQANTRKKEDIKDLEAREQVDELERSLKVSRQRWRIMKGTASGVVVGSGMDWSRDPELRYLVLDTEEDSEF